MLYCIYNKILIVYLFDKGEVIMSNIKYIGSDTKTLEKGKIHIKEGNYTGCGARIDDNPKD